MTKSGASKASPFKRLAAFKLEDLFSRRRPAGPPRTVFINEPLPQDHFDHRGRVHHAHVYASNQVITSKYTIITFLPRNLLEQFRRIANIFFLGISILQFFPKFSTIEPGAVILPLIIVLLITALKDGYEDFQRHQSDNRLNNTKVRVLAGGGWTNPNVSEGKSKTFVRATRTALSRGRKNKSAKDVEKQYDVDAADSTRPNRPYWKSTKWEDLAVGDFVKITDNEHIPADILICSTSEEENVAFVETMNLDGETNLKSRRAVSILTELNSADACANQINGFHVQCERPEMDMYRLNATVVANGSSAPADLSTTLLRGTVLRNTKWVIGVVLFTGLDSKVIMNSGGSPSKRSKVERQMNPQVLINLGLMAAMCVVCGIADSLLEVHYFPLGAPWLYGDDQSDDNPRINGLITWAFALLTFQMIVPISLYISIEFVRTLQAAFIYFDGDIYYAKTNQATQSRSWNLSDDLGQIEYIFSDKTGTLTQNSMVFRMCSVGGKAYRGQTKEVDDEKKAKIFTHSVSTQEVEERRPSSSNSRTHVGTDSVGRRSGSDDPAEHFSDAELLEDIHHAATGHNANTDRLNTFFIVLSLCHTVLAAKDSTTGHIEYKAQSPDEAALVRAAADAGFVFLGKDKEILSVQTPRSTEVEKYELLDILDFTSARKRMSVVLRRIDGGQTDDGNLLLLSKGADNVIFERLRHGEEDLKNDTEEHLSEFANSGLRTLTLAYRTVPLDEYEAWSERYHAATVALENREQLVENVSDELEQKLELLGATAIEDRLQDGVPETIADLKKAGIKIWVATGDKLETAIAIGRSTNLISSESNIIIVRGGSKLAVHEQMINALDQFFPEQTNFVSKDIDQIRSNTTDTTDNSIPLQRINTGISSIVGAHNGERPGGFILVADGAALLEAFASEESKAILLRLAISCDGVICCRVSPLQKAHVVRLVREGLNAMTLAIGDGANDVSMIQAAHVGVGISGEEGMQAVNSSDYAIAQFRFLKKLLLVHGHWSYARNGLMIVNFFHKNIVPTGVLWWFQIYNGWSGDYVFDYIYILFWNSLWTVAPVVGLGLFDRFLDSHVLMEVPELYHYGRRGTWFGLKPFAIFMLNGLVQSVIIFYLILYTYITTSARKDGYAVYIHEFSTTMALAAVLVADLFTGFTATAWTAWLFFAVFIGIIVQWIFTVIYASISPGYAVTHLYGNNHILFHSPYFWLSLPLTFLLAMAPAYILKAWKFSYNPGDLETFQYLQTKYPGSDLSSFSRPTPTRSAHPLSGFKDHQDQQQELLEHNGSRRSSIADSIATLDPNTPRFGRPSLCASRTDMVTGITSVDRGFDFVTEEHGVEMRRVQTNLSERRMDRQNLNSHTRLRWGGHSADAPLSPSRKGKDVISGVFSLSRAFSKRKSPPVVSPTSSSGSTPPTADSGEGPSSPHSRPTTAHASP